VARSERTITPILVTQAMTLVLTTGVAIAWTTTELRDWRSQVEVPQQTMRDIESHVQEAVIAPFNFVGTRNPAAAVSARKATAQAQASLKILGNLIPELRTHTEATRSALEILDDASAGLWDGHAAVTDADIQSVDAILPSLALLEEAKDGVDRSLSTLTKKVASHANNHQISNRLGILGLWTGALAVYLLTGFTARRRFVNNEHTKKTELTEAIDGAVEALQAATSGKPVPIIPDHPMVAEFKSTIRAVATRLEDLHQTNRRIRRQFTFRHELVDALDLAESESEVIRTATRAARVAFPEKIFQLLVARPDEGTIEPIEESAPVACTLTCIESCPAARKGDVLYHHPDMGLSRCPRIRDEDTLVTCAPISVNGQAVGVVQLMGTPLEDGQEELLEALSTAVGVRTGVVRNLAERELAAGTDPLTELANRRAMDEHMRRLDGAEVPYTVIVADLDHFKQINDSHGHDVGDRCLQLFADILKEACRDTDIACRPGGEEFSLILSGAGTDAGMAVASRIHAMLAQETRRQGPVFTVSIGIAARPIHGERAEEILRSADVALYDAKDQGRDRCVLAEVPMSLEVVG
jgi:diguanylate cyclase (GGDEF)-like protein